MLFTFFLYKSLIIDKRIQHKIVNMKAQGNVIINGGKLVNSGPGVIGAHGKIVRD